MTVIEKIIAQHSNREKVVPGEIVDVAIDVRLARDFGGANVVRNLLGNGLGIADPGRTWFTFDCNPTGSDQQYAANQHYCRQYAKANGIAVFDIDSGIGTHLAIDQGLAVPGGTLVSTDSHANILGAIGCFGQGMGDRDIAAAWAKGAVWFKVPQTVRIMLTGTRPVDITAKDIALNLLKQFGADTLLGYSVELYGEEVTRLSLDERITISSMATEMGALILFIPPGEEVIYRCSIAAGKGFTPVYADPDAVYAFGYTLNLDSFEQVISLPGQPHNVVPVSQVEGKPIDSVFIGSCTNGRMEDMRATARIVQGRKIAPGVVLKIVPATDSIWNECLEEGLIEVFKKSGALVSNAGCAGCASGQVGQNGPGEVTVSTGNRNFTGKQGKGEVYLSSPEVAAASALAGHICRPENIPPEPPVRIKSAFRQEVQTSPPVASAEKHTLLEGRIWLIPEDNIDTDMIYHNRYLAVTDPSEMGRYAFGNLKGWENFSGEVRPGDIIIAGRNFGSGSSRQQAVDCFKVLGIQAIIARSFGAIYERNAINAGFPVLTFGNLETTDLETGDAVVIDLEQSMLLNKKNGKTISLCPFSEVQMKIYRSGDLLRL
jgi:3-isopropylmalate dehydratase small subunit